MRWKFMDNDGKIPIRIIIIISLVLMLILSISISHSKWSSNNNFGIQDNTTTSNTYIDSNNTDTNSSNTLSQKGEETIMESSGLIDVFEIYIIILRFTVTLFFVLVLLLIYFAFIYNTGEFRNYLRTSFYLAGIDIDIPKFGRYFKGDQIKGYFKGIFHKKFVFELPYYENYNSFGMYLSNNRAIAFCDSEHLPLLVLQISRYLNENREKNEAIY